MKKIVSVVLLLALTLLLLIYPKESISFAGTGLLLWFERMIPVLFPFMILSNLIIGLNLVPILIIVFYPFLHFFYRISPYGCYCILMGFLCGFPMGAKVVSDLYQKKLLTLEESNYLLAFCNNIGPIYFCSFALPLFGVSVRPIYLFGMYGIPLLYGVFLRNTSYKKLSFNHMTQMSYSKFGPSFFFQLDIAINNAIKSIVILGGYMIFFNLLNIIPFVLLTKLSFLTSQTEALRIIINSLIEITSGLSLYPKNYLSIALCALSFGGCCCICQTYSILKTSNLSIKLYIKHKLIITSLVIIYYFILYLF